MLMTRSQLSSFSARQKTIQARKYSKPTPTEPKKNEPGKPEKVLNMDRIELKSTKDEVFCFHM